MTKPKRKRHKFDKPLPEKINYNKILAHGLKFTKADLNLNRQGQLSDRQYEKQLNALAKRDRRDLFIYVSLFSFIVISMMFIFSRTGHILHLHTILYIVSAITFVILFVLVYSHMREVNKLRSDIQDRDVEYVVGPVTVTPLVQTVRAGNITYKTQIRVWDTDFEVSQRGAESFRHLDEYAIYYLPLTRIIISAEPV